MPGPITYNRDLPPAHFSLKISPFSLLSKSLVDKYDSGIFKAGGYSWSLSLYPNGDKDSKGSGYISLYLTIEETNKLPHDWEVKVNYKLFVYDETRNTYLTMQDADGAVRKFHKMKTRWGFAQFLSLETFKDSSNGYLVDDSCLFGAEVLVIQPTDKLESIHMIKDPTNRKFTWKMKKFSTLEKDECHFSDAFTVGESSWKLKVYPKGSGDHKGKSLSIYLTLSANQDTPQRKVYRQCNFRVLDQLNDNHKEKTTSRWVKQSDTPYGFEDFMSLTDLHKPANGFIYNDVLIVEVQFLTVSTIKVTGV